MQKREPMPALGPAESYLFLDELTPTFTSVEIAPDLVVHKIEPEFIEKLSKRTELPEQTQVAPASGVCIRCTGTSHLRDLMRPHAFHLALVLATDVRSHAHSQIINDLSPLKCSVATTMPGQGTVLWGHFKKELTCEDVSSAKALLPRIEPYQAIDKFSRVGNALLFYQNGYNSDNPDLALMAFATCLESLFSTTEQELSFRLSLRVCRRAFTTSMIRS